MGLTPIFAVSSIRKERRPAGLSIDFFLKQVWSISRTFHPIYEMADEHIMQYDDARKTLHQIEHVFVRGAVAELVKKSIKQVTIRLEPTQISYRQVLLIPELFDEPPHDDFVFFFTHGMMLLLIENTLSHCRDSRK